MYPMIDGLTHQLHHFDNKLEDLLATVCAHISAREWQSLCLKSSRSQSTIVGQRPRVDKITVFSAGLRQWRRCLVMSIAAQRYIGTTQSDTALTFVDGDGIGVFKLVKLCHIIYNDLSSKRTLTLSFDSSMSMMMPHAVEKPIPVSLRYPRVYAVLIACPFKIIVLLSTLPSP